MNKLIEGGILVALVMLLLTILNFIIFDLFGAVTIFGIGTKKFMYGLITIALLSLLVAIFGLILEVKKNE